MRFILSFLVVLGTGIAIADQELVPEPSDPPKIERVEVPKEKPTYEQLEEGLRRAVKDLQKAERTIAKKQETIDAQLAAPITQAAHIAKLEKRLEWYEAELSKWRDKANEEWDSHMAASREVYRAHSYILLLIWKYQIDLQPVDVYRPTFREEKYARLVKATEAWAEKHLDEYLGKHGLARKAK